MHSFDLLINEIINLNSQIMKKLLMVLAVALGTTVMVSAQTAPAQTTPAKEVKATKKEVKKETKKAHKPEAGKPATETGTPKK